VRPEGWAVPEEKEEARQHRGRTLMVTCNPSRNSATPSINCVIVLVWREMDIPMAALYLVSDAGRLFSLFFTILLKFSV
jgi:hypothetical protein